MRTPAVRKITVLGISPEHPGRGADSHVTLRLRLDYLKGEPVESITISSYVARKLAEEGIIAARIVDDLNAEKSRRDADRIVREMEAEGTL